MEITGLTKRQVQILEDLWALQEMDEVEEYIGSLPDHQDRLDAMSLITIVQQEVMEGDGYLDDYRRKAERAIKQIREM